MFTKNANKQMPQTKRSSRTRQVKTEAMQTEQEDELLTEKERTTLILQWAMNGFKPSGPKGFAPAEGIVHRYFIFSVPCSIFVYLVQSQSLEWVYIRLSTRLVSILNYCKDIIFVVGYACI